MIWVDGARMSHANDPDHERSGYRAPGRETRPGGAGGAGGAARAGRAAQGAGTPSQVASGGVVAAVREAQAM
jgi:hypothetical protein